jgi:dephospho-CoA kinase
LTGGRLPITMTEPSVPYRFFSKIELMAFDSLQHRIPVVGIVGGIGSGKSAVTKWVAAKANVMVIDADKLGHEALTLDSVKSALRQRFGDVVFDQSGDISRGALARVVFGNTPEHLVARQDLEGISHPAIEARVVQLINQAELEGREAVLLDAAVLFEAGWQRQCDAVVFVDASDNVRQRRVAARSGWSQEELRRRESSQLPLVEKKRLSNVVISNESDDSHGGQELLDFLCRSWSIGCKQLPNSSKQF